MRMPGHAGQMLLAAAFAVVALLSIGRPTPARAAVGAADSSFTPVGMWRHEGASREEWMIVDLFPYPGLVLLGQDGLQALGFYGEEGFEGVVKRPGSKALVPEPRGTVLRFRPLERERIAVEFAPALGAAATWRGTFARTSDQVPGLPRDAKGIRHASEAPAPAPEAGAAQDRLPAFGEYVYVEQFPSAAERVAPSYPESARAKGVQGTVMVQALVGRDGRVLDARVTSGVPGLDEAAIEAVRQWRFEPARTQGRPVAVWVAVPVKFTLK